jgi:hypothetical protein
MEILIGLGLILAMNEWRDYKFNRRHRLIEALLKQTMRKLHYVGDLAEKIEANNKAILETKKDLEPVKEFIHKASIDLQTIVQEYEVNGVPLGYDRGGNRHYDMVEGL